jgi:hypothetical protein
LARFLPTHKCNTSKKNLLGTNTLAYFRAASLARFLPTTHICYIGQKNLLRTKTLGYFIAASMPKEKKIMTSVPCVDVIKLFSFVADDEAK